MSELLPFFQLLATGDACLSPELVWCAERGQYHTVLSSDTSVGDAIAEAEEKEAADRERIAKIVSIDVESSLRVSAQLEQLQKDHMAKEMHFIRQREQQLAAKAKDAVLRSMDAEVKKRRRAEQLAHAAELREQSVIERQRRAVKVEQQTQDMCAQRLRERLERSQLKQRQLRDRAAAAGEKVAAVEQQRLKQLEIKEAYRIVSLRAAAEQRAAKAIERQERNKVMQLRQATIADRQREAAEQQQQRALEEARRCELQLEAFERTAKAAAYDRRLGDMKRQLMREEAVDATEHMWASRVQAMVDAKAARETRFHAHQQSQELRKLARRAEDEQLRAIKDQDLDRKVALEALEQMALAGTIEVKAQRAKELQTTREALRSRVHAEREKLADTRKSMLLEAHDERVKRERLGFLATFNAANPSDAETLREVNAAAVRRLHGDFSSSVPGRRHVLAMTPIPRLDGTCSSVQRDAETRPRTTSPSL
jgi:hypothetical protein